MVDDKWLMFKNYLHNELGITKEDIRIWLKEAIKEQAEKLIKNEFEAFSPEKLQMQIIKEIGGEDSYRYGSMVTLLRNKIADNFAKQIKISIKDNE